jgi:UPF0176 protein
MQLYNTLSAEERKIMIDDAGKQRLTLSFYAYAQIQNPSQFRNELFLAWNKLDVLGRIYVAKEGINAQLSLPANYFYDFKKTIEIYDFMQNLRLNIAIDQDDFSFLKLTIKVRDKIVADGLTDDLFDVTNIGTHLKAKDFNDLLNDKDTIVVDMRNHYESEIGHFKNAIKPDVDTFRESLPIIENELATHKSDKKILMYCTGGIRCEKASAYFKHKGFEKVYQLEGGIIEYTRQVKAEGLESKFIGKNFVFDHRLGERITEDVVSNCHQCGKPCDNHTNCVNDGCHLLFIQCDACQEKMENCCSIDCQNTIHLPLDEQVKLRSGLKNGNKIFKKGKSDVLLFKNNDTSISINEAVSQKTTIKKEPKSKKIYLGKVVHFFVKAQIAQFEIEENEIKIGEKLLIKGKTTGNQEIIINAIFMNQMAVKSASAGDSFTMKIDFRVRLSDKFYKIVE